jgi:transcriptional regulator with XRE-family HTH domain
MSMESSAPRPGDPLDAFVGERVRSLRHQRAVSLQVVAERAELSVGFLSQIERGLSSPTLRDLFRIAAALDTDLGFFFDADGMRENTSDSIVVRLPQRQNVAFHAGVVKHRLTPPGDSPLVMYMVTIEPHGRTGEALYTHRGEEAGLVLQGRLLLTVENTDHLLNEGDSFRFHSNRPHRFSNPAGTVTRVVWVNVTQPEMLD